jgi:hypothetical protein
MRANLASNGAAIAVMLGAVALQVAGAVLLKSLADNRAAWGTSVVFGAVLGVIGLNVARLWVWGQAHRRFPLSTTFPLSSLFFPAMLLVAVVFDDEIGFSELAGVLLITSGTFWLASKVGN